jgi:ankyrin repeat protein
MQAATHGHKDCVRRLISAGAQPYLADGGNRTARMYAEQEGHAEVAEILREAEEKATDFSKGLSAPMRATKPLEARKP